MAEGSGEILEAEISFQTAEAVRNAKEFSAAVAEIDAALAGVDAASTSAQQSIATAGASGGDAAGGISAAGDAAATAAGSIRDAATAAEGAGKTLAGTGDAARASGDAVLSAGDAAGKTAAAMADVGTAASGAQESLAAAATAGGDAATGVGSAADAADRASGPLSSAGESAATAAEKIADAGEAAGEAATGISAAGDAGSTAAAGLDAAREAAGSAKKSIGDAATAADTATTANKNLNASAKDAGDSVLATGEAAKNASGALGDAGKSAGDLAKSVGELPAKAADAGKALTEAGENAADASKEIDKISTATDAAADSTRTAGDTSKRVWEEMRKAADAEYDSKQRLKKIDEDLRESEKRGHEERKKEREEEKIEIPEIVKGYLGFAAVEKILDSVKERLKDVKEATADLVADRVKADQSLRGVAFNLGLPSTQAGIDEARKIVEEISKGAPVATEEQVGGAIAAGSNFGIDPRTPAGSSVITQVSRVAGLLELNRQSTADLVKYLGALGATSPDKANKELAQFLAAARATPIDKPDEFARAFIKATLPMRQGGASGAEAAGAFAAAAVGETSATRAATRAEQADAIIAGRDDKSRAALFERARSTGVLSADAEKQLRAAARDVTKAMSPQERDRYDAIKREVEQVDEAEAREDQNFKRDMDNIDRDTIAARSKGRDIRDLVDRRARRQEQFDKQQTAFADRRAALARQSEGVERKVTKDVEAKIYEDLPLAERRRMFGAMIARAKTPQEREDILGAAGTSPEQRTQLREMFSPEGQKKGAEVTAAVGAARPESVGEESAAFAETDIGQRQASEAEDRRQAAGTTTSGEVFADTFEKEAEGEVKRRLRDAGRSTDRFAQFKITVRLPFSGGSFTVLAGTKDYYHDLVACDLILRKAKEWWESVPRDLKRSFRTPPDRIENWFREWESHLADVGDRNLPTMSPLGAEVDKFAVQLGNLQREFTEQRQAAARNNARLGASGPPRPRATDPKLPKPFKLPEPGGEGSPGGEGGAGEAGEGREAPAAAGGESPRGDAGFGGGEIPGAAAAPAGMTATAAAAYSGPRVVYNVNVGQVVSRGGDVMDFVGPLEGES
jgi:hypothetical protein